MPAAAATGNPSLLRRVRQQWRLRLGQWLRRRIPPARQLVLGHRNIFILPSRQGLGFLFVLALMYIGAVNYEANLAFALVFLLVGMFVLSIFHTYRNLAGLQLAALPGAAVFAGEPAEFTVILNRRGRRSHEGLQLGFAASRRGVADLLHGSEQRVSLQVPTQQRGWLDPGRLLVETQFPFGICRAWSLLDLQLRALVYPRPLACELEAVLASPQHGGHTRLVRGSDDFHGLRAYRAGDPLRHVAWKNVARGQDLLVKEYSSSADQQVWLRWEQFADCDVEGRLSRLCWCVLQLEAGGIPFGLALPGCELAPALGPGHVRRALETLALFGQGGDAA